MKSFPRIQDNVLFPRLQENKLFIRTEDEKEDDEVDADDMAPAKGFH